MKEKTRKYTDNLIQMIKKPRNKSKENEKSTDIEGGTEVTPIQNSRKESGFEGNMSSNFSTPTVMK